MSFFYKSSKISLDKKEKLLHKYFRIVKVFKRILLNETLKQNFTILIKLKHFQLFLNSSHTY
jgi:hypothetical protein